jgi:hypothetical protein
VSISLRLPKTDRECLIVLAVVYLLLRLPLLSFTPLIQDENLYAMMAQEQLQHLTLLPTFLGYAVSWKPALTFWVYAGFSKLFSGLLPLEAVYRFPSVLFGLLSIPPLYFLLRNAGSTRLFAFFTLLIAVVSVISIYPQAAFLTDSLLFLLICSSLWLYTESRLPAWRFLAAGALAFAAFFVKLVIAFMIPLLAAVYFYAQRRETLRNPLFLVSLLAVPAALLLNFALLQSSSLATQLYVSDIGGHLLGPGGTAAEAIQLRDSASTFFSLCGIWFALSLYGLWKYWRTDLFMACWYLLLVFPLLTGAFMPWYFLPVLPAVAYFAVAALMRWEGKEKVDRFFLIILSLLLLASIPLLAFYYLELRESTLPQEGAGLLLSGKENALIIGTYAPDIIAYKTLTELRASGQSLDVGWIDLPSPPTEAEVLTYVSDYHSMKYPIVDGSFTSSFTTNATFRKDSNLTSFDYVAVVDGQNISLPGFSAIYNETYDGEFNVTVYAR